MTPMTRAAGSSAAAKDAPRVAFASVAGLVLALVAAGCASGSGHRVGVVQVPPVATQPPPSSSSPSAGPSPMSSQPPSSGGAAGGDMAGPADGPLPRGFVPTDVTFVSDRLGWAIGTATCSIPPCTSVVRTRDGGRTWAGIPAPRADLVGLRFADPRDGFAFGAGGKLAGNGSPLWATHDAGASWHVTRTQDVIALEPGAGVVYAVTQSDAPQLLAGTPGGDDLRPVAQLPALRHRPGALTVRGRLAYVVNGGGLPDQPTELTELDGQANQKRLDPCPGGASAVLGASGDTDLALVCAWEPGAGSQQKAAFTSSDSGRSWTPVGAPPSYGYVGSVAATGNGTFLAGSRSPVFVTRDAGRTWTVALADPGEGWWYVGFTTPTFGVALMSGSMPEIAVTRDAGRTWSPYRFPQ